MDTRELRKAAGMDAKEQKKDYEKALALLQNFADVVITGAKEAIMTAAGAACAMRPRTIGWNS